MKRTLNLGPFGVYLWGGILLASSAVFGAGSILYSNQNTGAIYSQHLANGTPGAGKYPRGGACPTGTSIDTSTGTTDRQCWTKIPISDVEGAVAKNGIDCTDASTITTSNGQVTGCLWGMPVFDTRSLTENPSYFPTGVRFDLKLNGSNGLDDGGYFNSVMSWRRWGTGGDWSGGSMLQLAYTDNGNLWTRYSPLGSWSTWKKLTISAPADIGAEPALPACKPGEGIIYTGTGTDASTAKGCGTITPSGTTNYLPKKTASGWGDSSVFETTSGPVESGRAMRINGSTGANASGEGLVMSYYPNSHMAIITSYSYPPAATHNMSISASDLYLYGDTSVQVNSSGRAFTFPSDDDQPGECLHTDGSGATYWSACSSGTNVMPGGEAGQIAKIVTSVVTTTTTSTATATSIGSSWAAVSPFGTASPTSNGTSNVAGTSTSFSRDDHQHQGDGNDKVAVDSSHAANYLANVVGQGAGLTITNSGAGTLNFAANIGTGAGQVCSATDSRLSDARTPTAHGSTHLGNAGDPIADANGTRSGLEPVAHYNLVNGATATPAASRIMISNAAGNANSWLSVSADPFSNTPGVGKVATITTAGQTLNGWVTGILVNTEVLTSSSTYWTTQGGGWVSGPSYTFTSNGTRLNVTVEATISPSVYPAGFGFCALTIVADNGATATTQRGKETFLVFTPNGAVVDVPTTGYYLYGTLSNHANFTLGSTGQTTITVRMYQGGDFTACTVLSGYLKMYVDVYK